MDANQIIHSKLRPIIFFYALILSTAIIGVFLCRVPNNLPMQIGAGAFTIFLEASMAYVLSLIMAYWQRNDGPDRAIAGILSILWTSYVFIACISAIMLFMSELNVKDVVAKERNDIQQINRAGYDQAVKDVKLYSGLMETEKATGAKARFEKWRGLKEAAEDRKNYYEAHLVTQPTEKESEANIQGNFAQIFPGAWKGLLVTIFGIIMAVIYLMQVITAPAASLKPRNATRNTVTNVTPPRATRKCYTAKPRVTVTGETVTGDLCVCGCGRPARPGSHYYSDACRVRMSRRRKALASGSAV